MVFMEAGHSIYEIGPVSLFDSFFKTISINLENGNSGSRFPIIMNKFRDGKIDYTDLTSAIRELIVIKRELREFSLHKAILCLNDREKKVYINENARDLENYFMTKNKYGPIRHDLIRVFLDTLRKGNRFKSDVTLRGSLYDDEPYRSDSPVQKVWTPRGGFCYAFLSTVAVRLENENWGSRFPRIMKYFHKGVLVPNRIDHAIAEMEIIQQELKNFSPSEVVWDFDDRSKLPPWGDAISEKVTDLSNYFITPSNEDFIEVIFECLRNCKKDQCSPPQIIELL